MTNKSIYNRVGRKDVSQFQRQSTFNSIKKMHTDQIKKILLQPATDDWDGRRNVIITNAIITNVRKHHINIALASDSEDYLTFPNYQLAF